eukprot:4881146-Heterocapsa_arctica.AAC.1
MRLHSKARMSSGSITSAWAGPATTPAAEGVLRGLTLPLIATGAARCLANQAKQHQQLTMAVGALLCSATNRSSTAELAAAWGLSGSRPRVASQASHLAHSRKAARTTRTSNRETRCTAASLLRWTRGPGGSPAASPAPGAQPKDRSTASAATLRRNALSARGVKAESPRGLAGRRNLCGALGLRAVRTQCRPGNGGCRNIAAIATRPPLAVPLTASHALP